MLVTCSANGIIININQLFEIFIFARNFREIVWELRVPCWMCCFFCLPGLRSCIFFFYIYRTSCHWDLVWMSNKEIGIWDLTTSKFPAVSLGCLWSIHKYRLLKSAVSCLQIIFISAGGRCLQTRKLKEKNLKSLYFVAVLVSRLQPALVSNLIWISLPYKNLIRSTFSLVFHT